MPRVTSPVNGHEVLRIHPMYGIFVCSAPGGGPPAPGAEPLDIDMASGGEQGKAVWLGWKSLE